MKAVVAMVFATMFASLAGCSCSVARAQPAGDRSAERAAALATYSTRADGEGADDDRGGKDAAKPSCLHGSVAWDLGGSSASCALRCRTDADCAHGERCVVLEATPTVGSEVKPAASASAAFAAADALAQMAELPTAEPPACESEECEPYTGDLTITPVPLLALCEPAADRRH
jgi:hypothetical protein